MKTMFTALLSLLLLTACSSIPSTETQCFHKYEDFEKSIGFCSILKQGNTYYISGVAAPGTMDAAIKDVYGQISTLLNDHGLTFADIVKENVYAVDLPAFIHSASLRKDFYGASYPAATWVEVSGLFTPELVLEVEVIAVKDQ